jgi:hypothetical protein
VAIVPFDRNRSVSRVLEISLVPDGSRNGSNPDLSVVVLNRLTLRYGLVLRRSQNTTLLPTALLGHAGDNVLHTGASGERFDLDTLNHDNIDDRVSPQHRHREDSATAFQLRTKDVS